MATSAWFDYNGYMANKLAQVQKADTAAGWDMVKLVKAFADAGFVGDAGAEKHFQAHGQYEDVAPNAFFSATEYYRAKAAQVYGKDPKAVTDLDVASIQVAIKDSGMSAWSHYEKYGSTEKINPSNSFDTEAYMNAKLTALNSIKDGKQYTLTEVYDAFRGAGLSALEHFMMYGGAGTGEVTQKIVDGKMPAEFAVPEEKKVTPGGGSEGKTFPLTTGIDNILGTAGDDVIIGSAGANATLNAGDQINGGAGTDTLKVYADANVDFATIGLKSVEKLDIASSATGKVFTASQSADVKDVWLKGFDAELKVNSNQKVGLAGDINTKSAAIKISYAGTDGSADAALLALEGAKVSAAANGVNIDSGTVKLESLTIEAAGTNDIGTLTATNLKTLTLTGTGSVEMDAANVDSALTTIDASKLAGGLEFAFHNDATSSTDLKFTGSSNADKLTIDAADINKKDVLDGGAGKDTLVFSTAANGLATGDNVSNVSNFEVLEFGANGNVDLSLFSAKNTLEGIVIAADFNGTGISNITGAALNDIRFTEDVSSISLSGKDFSDALFTGKKAATLVLDDVTGATNGDVDVHVTFADAKELTIESLIKDGSIAAVVDANGTADDGNSLDLTASSVEKLFIKGNQTVTLTFDAGDVAGGCLVDASGLTNKASLVLTIDDIADAQSFAVIGSAGNDYITFTGTNTDTGNDTLSVVDKGGSDHIVFDCNGNADVDTLKIKLESVDFKDAAMIGSDIVASNMGGSGALFSGDKVVLDLTTEFAGKLTRGGNVIATAAAANDYALGATLSEGGKFGAGNNITVADSSGKYVIQIDVNSDGVFNAAEDYQLTLVGASGSTMGYSAATGDFTFTSTS